MTQVSSTIKDLKDKREVDPDDPNVIRQLRNEQTKVSLSLKVNLLIGFNVLN